MRKLKFTVKEIKINCSKGEKIIPHMAQIERRHLFFREQVFEEYRKLTGSSHDQIFKTYTPIIAMLTDQKSKVKESNKLNFSY